jgi:hypothetical protein
VSVREKLDTGGPLGTAAVVIVSAVAELVCNFIIERVRAGLTRTQGRFRAKWEATSHHRETRSWSSIILSQRGHSSIIELFSTTFLMASVICVRSSKRPSNSPAEYL